MPSVRIWVICGNIGAGKSTLLRELRHLGHIIIEEPLRKWGFLLAKSYETGISVKEQQNRFFLFQSMVFAHYVEVTARLLELQEKEKSAEIHHNVFVERCPAEALNVFLPLNREKFNPSDYEALRKMHERLLQSEIWAEKATYIYLDVPPELCFKRIRKRNREGEAQIPMEYLCKLENLQHQRFLPLLPDQRTLTLKPEPKRTGAEVCESLCETVYQTMHVSFRTI
jgi:deoxyadenosine/deoxycytidine kinase